MAIGNYNKERCRPFLIFNMKKELGLNKSSRFCSLNCKSWCIIVFLLVGTDIYIPL